MKREVRTRFFSARFMSEALVRELWRLRLDYFHLGEGVTEEEDWRDFSAFFERERREVIVFFDEDDEVVGFYVNSFDVMELEGREAVVISIEYTYIRSAWRGHPSTIAAGFRLFGALLWRYRGMPMYYAGFNFPNSYAFVNATFGQSWTLQEECPPFERHVLEQFASTTAGEKWDRTRNVAVYKNVPPVVEDLESKPLAIRAIYDKYERLNPRWREGDCIAVLIPVTPRVFGSTVRRIARRAIREARR